MNIEHAVDAAYDVWVSALSKMDAERFGGLLDERWFGTAQDGTTVDADRIHDFMALTPIGMHLTERIVISHEDLHLVRGAFATADPARGQVRFVSLWTGAGESLSCLTHHETRVVESAFADKPPTGRHSAHSMTSHADAVVVDTFRSIYDDLARAMPAQDLVHLDDVIDESWFTTDPGGQLRDKSEYMDFARTYYAPSLTFDVSELFVRVCAPFAVVSCRYTLGGRFGDGVAPNQAVRVTGIWLQRDGDWTYMAQQGSFIP